MPLLAGRVRALLGAALVSVLLSSATVARADEVWRDVDPDNLVLLDTQYGRVAIELAPDFAPKMVERFKALIRTRFYVGKYFYRVIDGFVAQGGIGEGDDKKLPQWPALKGEFERELSSDFVFTPLGNSDLHAPEAGHLDGFPAGRDPATNKAWLIHCYGTVAVARDDNPDTGATEFYIVIGHAPRRLDRNLTVFGRVIDGMEFVQKLNRGNPEIESGVIQDPGKRDPILNVRMANELPDEQRPLYQVMRTESPAFAKRKEERRNINNPFYVLKPPPVLDICGLTVPVRLKPKS